MYDVHGKQNDAWSMDNIMMNVIMSMGSLMMMMVADEIMDMKGNMIRSWTWTA